jgi:hypothetical protein
VQFDFYSFLTVGAYDVRLAFALLFRSEITSCSLCGTLLIALQTGGFTVGTPARSTITGDYLLSVFGLFGPKHLSLFSPTGDPSKPGTGTTLLFYGGACAHPELRPAARTSLQRDETVVPLVFS